MEDVRVAMKLKDSQFTRPPDRDVRVFSHVLSIFYAALMRTLQALVALAAERNKVPLPIIDQLQVRYRLVQVRYQWRIC